MSIHPVTIDGLTYDLNFICSCIDRWFDNGDLSSRTYQRLQNAIVAFEDGVIDADSRFNLPLGYSFGTTDRRQLSLLEYMVFTWDVYHEIDFETADETFEESIIDFAPEIHRDDLYYMVLANGDDNDIPRAQVVEMMHEPVGELDWDAIVDEAMEMCFCEEELEEAGLNFVDLTQDDDDDETSVYSI